MEALHECSFCGNMYTESEGFRIDTGQCEGCQKWDDEKPQRDKELKERMEFLKKVEKGYFDFPYVAGDPFW